MITADEPANDMGANQPHETDDAQKRDRDRGDERGGEHCLHAHALDAHPEALGGLDRYLTFLSTDKPIYRAGETVFVRGVLLHQATRRPLAAAGRGIIARTS